MMNNFWQRTITGTVFVTAMLVGTLFSAWSFLALLFMVNFLCLLEFYELMLPDKSWLEKYLGVIAGSIINLMFAMMVKNDLSLAWFYHLIPVFSLLFIVKLFENTGNEFETLAFQVLGIMYISFPLSMLAHLGYFNALNYSYTLPLGIFILQWCSDTFAYLAGRALGKHKLFERISPKKTWEGLIGSLLLTVGAAVVIAHFWDDLSRIDWMVVAALVVIFGSMGDLVESLLKRNIGIKDSGTFLPGHGGFLDRFDGIFLSVPAVYFYLLFSI
jgi:phosphatidate cytidylyltransferase